MPASRDETAVETFVRVPVIGLDEYVEYDTRVRVDDLEALCEYGLVKSVSYGIETLVCPTATRARIDALAARLGTFVSPGVGWRIVDEWKRRAGTHHARDR